MAEAVKKKKKTFDLGTLGITMGTVESDPYRKTWLIYGPPGAGKTLLGASAVEVPELGPVLHIDFEAGTASLEGLYAGNENLTVIQPADWRQAQNLFNTLVDDEVDHGYKTIVLDTVGKMMEYGLDFLNERPSSNGYELWGKIAEVTLDTIELLHRSGLNVIVLAHAESETVKGSDINVQPQFKGKLTGKEAPKIFDIIGYLSVDTDDETDEPVRILQTDGINNVTAKDRTDALPVYAGNPTMKRLLEHITSGKRNKGRGE